MKINMTAFCLVAILGLVFSGCTPTPAPCTDTFTVTTIMDTNDGACTEAHCSLREAVIAANACSGPQIILLPAGNYALTLTGADEDAAATGDLDITDDLTIEGSGVPSIDGVSSDRIFEIFSTAVVNLDHLILMNGLAQLGGAILSHGDLTLTASSIHNNAAVVPAGGSGASSGGGIFIETGTTTLIGTDVFDNTADYGAGIHNFATASFYMTGGHLTSNTATGWGGGLWNNMAATATLSEVEISFNTASERGGGIYNNGSLEATQVTFDQNIVTGNGGGVYNDYNGTMILRISWFTNNSADLGGGLFNRGLLHLYQSSLTNNSALGGFGGGAYNDSSTAALLLQNTTVSGNMIDPLVTPGGSGVYNSLGELRLEFTTFAYNNADGLGNSGGLVNIRSSIFAYHALGNCSGVTGGSQGYNIEDQDTCAFTEPSDLIETDPLLEWLATNGGVTLSHALSAGSPAIDSGDPDRCIEMDQRGVSRPQGAGCDRGAIEMETVGALPMPLPYALALEPANCRRGPDTLYGSISTLVVGQMYEIRGRDAYGNWWQLVLPGGSLCWVADPLVEVVGDRDKIIVVIPEPLATDTPTPVFGCWVGKQCILPCPAGATPGSPCVP